MFWLPVISVSAPAAGTRHVWLCIAWSSPGQPGEGIVGISALADVHRSDCGPLIVRPYLQLFCWHSFQTMKMHSISDCAWCEMSAYDDMTCHDLPKPDKFFGQSWEFYIASTFNFSLGWYFDSIFSNTETFSNQLQYLLYQFFTCHNNRTEELHYIQNDSLALHTAMKQSHAHWY